MENPQNNSSEPDGLKKKKRTAFRQRANEQPERQEARAPKRQAKELLYAQGEQVTFQKALEFFVRAETRAAGEKESFIELLRLQRELVSKFNALVSEHVRLLDAEAENRQLIARLENKLEKLTGKASDLLATCLPLVADAKARGVEVPGILNIYLPSERHKKPSKSD